MSHLFIFILNNWLTGKDEAYVNIAFLKGYITAEEKSEILATPRH